MNQTWWLKWFQSTPLFAVTKSTRLITRTMRTAKWVLWLNDRCNRQVMYAIIASSSTVQVERNWVSNSLRNHNYWIGTPFDIVINTHSTLCTHVYPIHMHTLSVRSLWKRICVMAMVVALHGATKQSPTSWTTAKHPDQCRISAAPLTTTCSWWVSHM